MARRIILPVIALVLAGFTAYLARSWMEEQRRPEVAAALPEATIETKSVLVAATPLDAGTFVQSDALRWQEWPDVTLPESYYVEGSGRRDDLVGAVVRQPIDAGEPITEGNIVMPGDRGFLAAVLNPDMRAVSVPVDDASSNAGLILPGDHVDLILTQTLDEEEMGDRRRVSETVLEDVRVIAMGRRLHGEEPEEGSRNQVRTATLEVTPAGAQKVAVVTELGRLSLSLRSLAQSDEPASDDSLREDLPTATWDRDVSRALGGEKRTTKGLAVLRGNQSETVEFGSRSAQ